MKRSSLKIGEEQKISRTTGLFHFVRVLVLGKEPPLGLSLLWELASAAHLGNQSNALQETFHW